MQTKGQVSNQTEKVSSPTSRPVALQSEIDLLKFTVGYCTGQELWWDLGIRAFVKCPGGRERGAESLGVWKGYSDARYAVQRHVWYGTVEAYNEVVREIRGKLPEPIQSPIDFADFSAGYVEAMSDETQRPVTVGEMQPGSAYEMGVRKARLDKGARCDRTQKLVIAYNETELESRRLGFRSYGEGGAR